MHFTLARRFTLASALRARFAFVYFIAARLRFAFELCGAKHSL
jgi:hypothetical protein